MPFDASPQRAPYRRPRLDIRDLHVVLAIAGARSTAKAATALHLSQSAVSRALLSGDADIALLTTTPVRGRLNEEPLFSDEIVFVAGASHPLATRSTITPADLRESVLITSATTPPAEAQWFYTRVFGRRIPKLRFLRFPLTEAIMDAARAGMGIAIMSEWIASSYLSSGDLVIKRLKNGPLLRPWRIAFRPEFAVPAGRLAQALGGSAPRVYVP